MLRNPSRDKVDAQFGEPEPVRIPGYNGDAMEPFVTPDGRYLFFNNANDPGVNTDLHYAERVDDLTFRYRGPIGGVNTPSLEGVASMDRKGVFYFVSNRSYSSTSSTLYRGRFAAGRVSDIELVPGISRKEPGIVNFDAAISPDGEDLYFVDSRFRPGVGPVTAEIVLAHRRRDGIFERASNTAFFFFNINKGGLQYAPAISADGLELFFTHTDGSHPPAIFRSTRKSKAAPFDPPQPVSVAVGFVEGPALSPDERSLYYHRKENGRSTLYRITRK